MLKIDAHQHFWKYNPIRDSWITNEMSVIQKDFLPDELWPLLQQNGIDGCVAVQADQSEEETNFLLAQADTHNFIKGVVGWIDLQAKNIEERLIHYVQFDKLKGFRHILQGEEDRGMMLDSAFKRGISLLHKYGFTYDVLIFPDQLEFVNTLVSAYPNQLFVIDHIAKPYIKDQKTSGWETDIKRIAKHENVYCKISGLINEADWHNWRKEDFNPYLDIVTEAFGTKRIMYGSDWPVCLLAAPYEKVLDIVQSYYASYSADEQSAFFGGNASTFYTLS